jgi:NADH-quinone oxidoreductase subunit H
MKGKLLSIFLLVYLSSLSQTECLQVKDENDLPIPYATMVIKKNNHFFVGDSSGKFCTKFLAKVSRGDTILLSAIGYEELKTVFTSSTPIVLKQKNISLPEIIIANGEGIIETWGTKKNPGVFGGYFCSQAFSEILNSQARIIFPEGNYKKAEIQSVAFYDQTERKVAAVMQDRIGPNRAGPFGLFQPLADGLKLFMKEEIIPSASSKFLFITGPALAMVTALMTSAVIPWGPSVHLFGRDINLQIADINIGMLYVFGVVSLGVYGIMIGGWASNNKFSLLAAIRGASQMISYELAMGLCLIALLMLTGSLRLSVIVSQQSEGMFNWNIMYQPIGFIIFFICALAECNRTPFDLPEAENELNFGYHQEYSSMKLGFYLFAEYINMFISGVVISTLYFGGYDIPFVNEANWGHAWWVGLVGFAVLMTKAIFFVLVFMWIRWTIPRFRYDQLMNLGWKSLIPLSLLNMVATAVVILLLKK